eukprot:4486195-Pleurochrysis_carterae.AAC.3
MSCTRRPNGATIRHVPEEAVVPPYSSGCRAARRHASCNSNGELNVQAAANSPKMQAYLLYMYGVQRQFRKVSCAGAITGQYGELSIGRLGLSSASLRTFCTHLCRFDAKVLVVLIDEPVVGERHFGRARRAVGPDLEHRPPLVARRVVEPLHFARSLARDTHAVLPDGSLGVVGLGLARDQRRVARLVLRREQLISRVVHQARLLVDHQVVNLVHLRKRGAGGRGGGLEWEGVQSQAAAHVCSAGKVALRRKLLHAFGYCMRRRELSTLRVAHNKDGVVLLLEAIANVRGKVDRLAAQEAKLAIKGLVGGKIPLQQALVVLEDAAAYGSTHNHREIRRT